MVPSRGRLQRDTGQHPLPQEVPLSQMGEGGSVSPWGPRGVDSCLLPLAGLAVSPAMMGLPPGQTAPPMKQCCVAPVLKTPSGLLPRLE